MKNDGIAAGVLLALAGKLLGLGGSESPLLNWRNLPLNPIRDVFSDLRYTPYLRTIGLPGGQESLGPGT